MTHASSRCDRQASGAIDLYFYGELSAGERQDLETHLSECAACRGALEELTVIRAALATRPAVTAPVSGDWTGFMSRLDAAVAQASQAAGPGQPRGRQTPWTVRRTPYAGYLAMAALLALVTMSVLFTARSRSVATDMPSESARDVGQAAPAEAPGEAAPAAAQGQDAERSPNAAFAALSDEHFERSKLVVLGLATKDPSRSSRVDWQYERSLASTLLSDTRMYRMAAEHRGMGAVAGVMRDLELVLLQTSLTDDADPAALGQIQRLISKRDLLEKLNVVSTLGL